MNMIDGFLGELAYEAAQTRKALERLPEEKFGWKPHEKSFTLGRLASHIAEIPGWVEVTLLRESYDAAEEYVPFDAKTRAELLEVFDRHVSTAQAAMPGTSNEALLVPWRLMRGETVLLEMPRVAVVRSFILSHLIHHRAQLTVYMRLLDIPVPALYGPSADEQG